MYCNFCMKRILFLTFSMILFIESPLFGQISVDADSIKVWVDNAQELYDKGDYKGAYEWYLMAAEKSHPFAEFAIGALYFSGIYVKQDYEKAFFGTIRLHCKEKQMPIVT